LTPGKFSLTGLKTTGDARYGGTQLDVEYSYAGGIGSFAVGTAYTGGTADWLTGWLGAQAGNFNQTDLTSIYSKMGELGFDAYSQYYTPPTAGGTQIPDVPPAFNPGPSETPATVTSTSSSTNPTSPTQNSSVGTENLSGNGNFSGSSNIFEGNQGLGWATFAAQVQGNRLFNEAQGQLQNLLNSTGQGNSGQIVDQLMGQIGTGAATLGMGLQVSDRYDMKKVRNGRQKIGYEQTKTFEQGSQAAQLGKPTLLGQ